MNPKTEQEEVRYASESDPFCGLAFKIATDPFVGRLAFVRVYSGKLMPVPTSWPLAAASASVSAASTRCTPNKQNLMETVGAGDICAAVGFKEIRTGDTLCAENAPIVLEQMTFPEPVIGLAVSRRLRRTSTSSASPWGVGWKRTSPSRCTPTRIWPDVISGT